MAKQAIALKYIHAIGMCIYLLMQNIKLIDYLFVIYK